MQRLAAEYEVAVCPPFFVSCALYLMSMHPSPLPDVITVNEAEPCVCVLLLTQSIEAPVLCNTL